MDDEKAELLDAVREARAEVRGAMRHFRATVDAALAAGITHTEIHSNGDEVAEAEFDDRMNAGEQVDLDVQVDRYGVEV